MAFKLSKIPPQNPGVYQYKDIKGNIIYIGKAKNLSRRVRSYFNAGQNLDAKTRQLVANIADVEYIITDTEVEALILESILIRKHKPRFNIKLRDDKNYQFIIIDYSEDLPQVYSTRRKGLKDAKYFGPYTSGLNVRNTISLIKKIFPYCTAKKIGGRPCFNYQLHRCPGVCIGMISPEEYKASFKQVESFLQGKTDWLKKQLHKDLAWEAKKHEYEKAARSRDQLKALSELEEQQKIIATHTKNQDYISLWRSGSHGAVNIFLVREGKLLSKESLLLDSVDEHQSDAAVLTAFLQSYYLEATNIGKEIILQNEIEDEELINQFLQLRFKETTGSASPIRLLVPKRGTAHDLILLGAENARNFLEQQLAQTAQEEAKAQKALLELKEILNLPKLPLRIECFDISNISGKSAVGSMVVFVNGRPRKDHYRKFKIKTKHTPDDYTMMAEVLTRRLHNDWPKADLWVIDGGKGQLNIATEVLAKENSLIPVIGLAKNPTDRGDKSMQGSFLKSDDLSGERIFRPDQNEPLSLARNNFALNLIQRLRDEAHRFAITYHRDLRSRDLFK